MVDEQMRSKLVGNAERIVGEMTGAVVRTLEAITPLIAGGDAGR